MNMAIQWIIALSIVAEFTLQLILYIFIGVRCDEYDNGKSLYSFTPFCITVENRKQLDKKIFKCVLFILCPKLLWFIYIGVKKWTTYYKSFKED